MENKKYTLYFGKIPKNPLNEKYTFIPPLKNYILVYTANDLSTDKNFSIVPEKIKLSELENNWLVNAKIQINKEALKEREDELLDFINGVLDDFEKELKNLNKEA